MNAERCNLNVIAAYRQAELSFRQTVNTKRLLFCYLLLGVFPVEIGKNANRQGLPEWR